MSEEDLEPSVGAGEQPDRMTDDDMAASDRVLDRLGAQWYAEDVASGRIQPPRARKSRAATKAKRAPAATEPEPWIFEQWRREDEMRAYEREHPGEDDTQEEQDAPANKKGARKAPVARPKKPARKSSEA